MKKLATAFLLSAAVAAPAVAADNGFYAGLTLGRSNTGNIAVNTVMTKSTDTVLGVLAGYQFTKNWGVEAQYTSGGNFTAVTTAPVINVNGKSDALSLAAVGTLPVSDALSLYAKLGIASTKTRLSTVPLSNATGATRSTATVGLGLQYNASPNLGVRFGWDRYGDAINAGGLQNKFNNDIYSLGLVYSF